jgi:hypothetical protein
VKICVAAVEVLMKKERQDETQFTTKIGGKTSLVLKFQNLITYLDDLIIIYPSYQSLNTKINFQSL